MSGLDEGQDDTNIDDVDEELEQIEEEARRIGWVPEDKFKGRKDHWVDAKTFLERGEQLMPILRENNKTLQKKLENSTTQISDLSEQVQNLNSALSKMEKHLTQASKQKVTDAKAALKSQIKEARESNDIDTELELRDRLDEAIAEEKRILAEEEEANKREKPAPKLPNQPELSPDIKSWMKDNPWFSSTEPEDMKRAKKFARFSEDLRDEGTDLTGREFLDEALRLFEEENGEEPRKPPARRPSKVEGNESTRRPPNSSGNAKGFNSLPRDAQQACMSFADDLVGPNKRYKTLDDWKKQYAKDYYEGED